MLKLKAWALMLFLSALSIGFIRLMDQTYYPIGDEARRLSNLNSLVNAALVVLSVYVAAAIARRFYKIAVKGRTQ